MGVFWYIDFDIINIEGDSMINSREGNKKISLLLVLKALEQMSDEQHPISQIHLVKMVNDIGGLLNQPIWCDRKTIGRHIKLLIAAGYHIVNVRGKGYYLLDERFTKRESEVLMELVNDSNLSSEEKGALQRKLVAQQNNIDIKKLKEYLTNKK